MRLFWWKSLPDRPKLVRSQTPNSLPGRSCSGMFRTLFAAACLSPLFGLTKSPCCSKARSTMVQTFSG